MHYLKGHCVPVSTYQSARIFLEGNMMQSHEFLSVLYSRIFTHLDRYACTFSFIFRLYGSIPTIIGIESMAVRDAKCFQPFYSKIFCFLCCGYFTWKFRTHDSSHSHE